MPTNFDFDSDSNFDHERWRRIRREQRIDSIKQILVGTIAGVIFGITCLAFFYFLSVYYL